MNCIFNELSFAEFVDSAQKLLPAIRELFDFQAVGRSYGHITYIHRDGLYATTICGQGFRQAVNHHIQDKEDKRRIFSLLDRNAPVLPDDTAIPTGCHFFYCERGIPCTGLAECAFRLFMEDSSLAYSLSCTAYNANPLSVRLKTNAETVTINVPNFTGINNFRCELDRTEPEIHCWEDLFQRAARLSYVRIEPSARESLTREPFETSLGKTVWERLKSVEKMATSSGNAYTELIKIYCHGENAIFSDESKSRINDLEDKLYFQVNVEKKLCSFHGKIRHRSFRIHMDKQPVPGEIVAIVYIGYKIL